MAEQSITVYEQALAPAMPSFAALLAPIGMPAERLKRTVLVALERTPRLRECSVQSVVNAAMTAAVLGLEVDGVTGQAFLVPYRNKGTLEATLQIGYKGMPTIAERSGYSCNAGVVREGDQFDFQEGSGGFVRHKRKLGDEAKRKIIAAWAVFEKPGRMPVIAVLSIDQIEQVKARSQGAKRGESPWNDAAIGYPAMAMKTAVRRAARLVPVVALQQAVAFADQVEDLGKPVHLNERGNIIDGQAEHVPEAPQDTEARLLADPNRFVVHQLDDSERVFKTVDQWATFMKKTAQAYRDKSDADRLSTFHEINREEMARIAESEPGIVEGVRLALA